MAWPKPAPLSLQKEQQVECATTRRGRRSELAILVLVASLVLCIFNPSVSKANPTGYYVTLSFPGARQAELYLPSHVAAHPQIWVILHGANEDLQSVEDYGFGELADRTGDVVVYPEGWEGVWNAGTCCFSQSGPWPDEVAYLNEVLASVQHHYPGAAPGIRAVGFSNGGMMAYTWACQQPKISGVAAVAGAWTSQQGCARPALKVHNIHAVSDEVVPYYGGPSAVTRTDFESQSDLYEHFPVGSDFVMHKLLNGGHGWPAFATVEIWDALH